MRYLVACGLVLFSGCKTLEIAVKHPTSGVHIVARVDARSEQSPDGPTFQQLPPLTELTSVPLSAGDG